jgi:hypothetical protein
MTQRTTARRPGETPGYGPFPLVVAGPGFEPGKAKPTVLQGAHYLPSLWPLTCGYSIPCRVKTAFCPCGVRRPGVCLVSATHPFGSCPRRSSRVQPHPILPLSPCHPRLRLGTSPRRPRPQPLTAPARQDSRVTVTPQKSGLSGHFSRPCHRFPTDTCAVEPILMVTPGSRPSSPPPRARSAAPRSASVRRARRSARWRERTARSRRTALPQASPAAACRPSY